VRENVAHPPDKGSEVGEWRSKLDLVRCGDLAKYHLLRGRRLQPPGSWKRWHGLHRLHGKRQFRVHAQNGSGASVSPACVRDLIKHFSLVGFACGVTLKRFRPAVFASPALRRPLKCPTDRQSGHVTSRHNRCKIAFAPLSPRRPGPDGLLCHISVSHSRDTWPGRTRAMAELPGL
jgi:hypothetical protein